MRATESLIRNAEFLLEEIESGHINLYGSRVKQIKVRRNFYHEPTIFKGGEEKDDY